MQIKLHKNAKTTLAVRKLIQSSDESINYLAKKFNLSWNTAKRWKNSGRVEDKTSRPNNLNITLTQG